MSVFQYPVEITGPASDDFVPLTVLVGTGSTCTLVPAALLRRLGVQPTEMARFRLADGFLVRRPIGETQIKIEGCIIKTVVVFGDDEAAVLGAYTLEGALLAVDPAGQRLVSADARL